MYGSSSLCLSDTYALVIDQLLLIKIMIIIDEGSCCFPLLIGKLFEKESIWRPTVDLQIYSSIVNSCWFIYD